MVEEYLLSLILLLLVGRTLGLTFQRFGIQPLVGEILAGALLGPTLILTSSSVLGYGFGITPSVPLEVFADFGILVLMLLTGIMTDFHSFREVRRSSIVIGTSGVILTFIIVFIPLHLVLGLGLTASLFIAALLSNTAIEVCASLLMNAPPGRLKSAVIGASFVDDVIAIFLIGVVSSMVFVGSIDLASILLLSVKVAAFLIISAYVFSRIIARLFDHLRKKSERVVLTATIITCMIFAIMARKLGLHEVIGAYIAGLLIGRWGSMPDPMLGRSVSKSKLINEIDAPLRAFFAPILFGYIGILFGSQGHVSIQSMSLLLLVIASLAFAGKIIGCGLGARLSGFGRNAALLIGIAMCGRGALELVLLRYGWNAGILSSLEYSVVVTAIVLTVMITPVLFSLFYMKTRPYPLRRFIG